jgi:predicted extracellular nuclease
MRGVYFFLFAMTFIFSSCEGDDAREPILVEEEFSADLFFSEYIEGTSFNKALEIVNLTGRDINLAEEGYSIKKQANGFGDWTGELSLTGTLAKNQVYVIGNAASEIPEIQENAHLLKAGAPMDFNGNDPIGLFKDGELIDVIGAVDSDLEFGKDMTLRRRPEITEPTTTYLPDEWDIYETDAVDGLGFY